MNACFPIVSSVLGNTSSSTCAPAKAILSIVVTPSGITTFLIAVILNADCGIVVKPFDSFKLSRLVHEAKQPSPSDVTLSGNFISVSAVLLKAEVPIDCNVSGRLMLLIVLFAKAKLSIFSSFLGKTTLVGRIAVVPGLTPKVPRDVVPMPMPTIASPFGPLSGRTSF